MKKFYSNIPGYILAAAGLIILLHYLGKGDKIQTGLHLNNSIYAEHCTFPQSELNILRINDDLSILESLEKSAGQIIILDTLITGLHEENSRFFLRTQNKINKSTDLFTFLECTENIFDEVRKSGNLNVTLVAEISTFNKHSVKHTLTDIDYKPAYSFETVEYHISGKCCEIFLSDPES